MHHLKKVVSNLQRSSCSRDAYSGVMPFPVKSQVSVTVVQLGIDKLTFTDTKNTGVNMRGACLEGGDGVPGEPVSREPLLMKGPSYATAQPVSSWKCVSVDILAKRRVCEKERRHTDVTSHHA